MTKAEIVAEISKSTGIEKESVLAVVEKFMEVVKDSLGNGENVYLRGFGSFILKERAEKTARNISKNTTLIIPRERHFTFFSTFLLILTGYFPRSSVIQIFSR